MFLRDHFDKSDIILGPPIFPFSSQFVTDKSCSTLSSASHLPRCCCWHPFLFVGRGGEGRCLIHGALRSLFPAQGRTAVCHSRAGSKREYLGLVQVWVCVGNNKPKAMSMRQLRSPPRPSNRNVQTSINKQNFVLHAIDPSVFFNFCTLLPLRKIGLSGMQDRGTKHANLSDKKIAAASGFLAKASSVVCQK